MAKYYRQNASYKDIGKTDGEEPEEDNREEKSSGNTGLPFGLCKKYGIALPPKATPRDAWNALKGIGIYPPWTEKGKGQYVSDTDPDTGREDQERISAHKKAIYDGISNKLSSFPKEYKDKLSESLENLDENELAAIAATFADVTYKKGDGSYRPFFNEIQVPTNKVSAVDSELGYTFGANTFYHEYGHYLAHKLFASLSGAGKEEGRDSAGWIINDFNELPEFQEAFAEDAKSLMNLAAKEAGLLKPVSVDRIKREEKQAFYSFLHKLSDKDIATLTKPIEPVLRTADREALVYSYKNYYGMTEENAQKRADEYIATQNKANEEKMLKYQKDLAFYEQNKDKIPRAKAVFQRYGVLSDFIAGATKGNISPYESGYWGHPASYWKSKSAGFGVRIPGKRNGVEPWAEYVACKMTKDEEGISIFREYLPKTFAKYEEVYAKMGGLLNERRP